MKTHTKECKNCCKTEGEDICFSDFQEMMEYGRANQSWYEKAWDFVYLPIYRVYESIRTTIGPRALKHYYQRARYGYSHRDVWDIHYHLADIIPKMIRDMKKNLNGCPSDIADKWGEEDKNDDDMKMAMYEWETVLDRIANAFELEYEILDHTLFDCRNKKEEKKMKKLMEDKDSFEGCRIMSKEEKEARNEGWKLFRKYFYSLWD